MDMFAPSILDILKLGKKALAWYKETELRKKYDKSQSVRLNPLLTGFLEFYYPYPLLRIGELSYPVVALKSPETQQQDLESILGELRPATRTDFVLQDTSYLELLRKQGKHIYNGRTYVMDKFEAKEGHRIRSSLGYYYDALTTCDVLEWEMLTTFDATTSNEFENVRRRLKSRNKYHEQVPDPVFDGEKRSAALSISTLIVFNDGETYQAFIRGRSGKTAAHSDLYHVVPSFMFQPVWGDSKKEYSIRHNIFREYLEEVFGVADMERSKGEISFDYFYGHEKLIQLQGLLKSKDAELFLTGYAMNLLNLRPEICTLLLIRDKNWLKQKIAANWEFLTPQQAYEERKEVILPIDILRDNDGIASDLSNIPGTFVPPGAAAFWLGVDLARKLI
jgi:hypothetical protein